MGPSVRNLAVWVGISAGALLLPSPVSAETLVVAAERTPDGLDTEVSCEMSPLSIAARSR